MTWAQWLFGEWERKPSEREVRLAELVRAYRDECEAFDRLVCTGPIGRDGIMPATMEQLTLINRQALQVRKRIFEGTNFSAREIREADARFGGAR